MLYLCTRIINKHTIGMKNHLFRTLALIALTGMYSCLADVDLTKVDPSVKVGFGAALHVGEVSMNLGAFLGDDILGDGLIVNEEGVLCFYDSVNMEVSIDSVDVAQYFDPAHAELIVGSMIPDELVAVADAYGIPLYYKLGGTDQGITLRDTLKISLGGINQPGASERIDSVTINAVEFASRITVDKIDLPFDKIEYVSVTLPGNFHREKGKVVNAQLDGKNYGQTVPLIIDDCVLDLMKNNADPAGSNNVIDTIEMYLTFQLALEKEDTVTIYPDSKFVFDFQVNKLDYAAVFGYFNATGLQSEKMEISFADMMPVWDKIDSFKLPISDPRIDIAVTSGIGAPLAIDINEISTTDRNTGKKAYASFDGSKSKQFFLSNLIWPTDPLDAVKRNEIHLSKDPSEGHIDYLFTVEPEKLTFDYGVCIKDTDIYEQMRITKQLSAKVEAEMTMPLQFNEGLNLQYTDTMDVNISSLSLDSLFAGTDIVDSVGVRVLKLLITVHNTLPFNILLTMTPLDEKGDKVMDMQPLLIAAPTEWEGDAATGHLVPGTNQLSVDVTEEKMTKLSEVKTLLYTARLCDSIDGSKLPPEAYPIDLKKDGQFSFDINIAASLDAYLNLSIGKK